MHLKFKLTVTGLILFISFSSLAQSKLSKSLGKYTGMTKEKEGITVQSDFGVLKIMVYTPTIIRVRASQSGTFDDFSYAVVAMPDANTKFNVQESADQIQLSTDSINLVISKNPLRLRFLTKVGKVINEDESFGVSWIGDEVTAYKKLQPNEKFIGLGEKTGNLNRRGEGYTNWNTDFFGYPTNADPIYMSTPFYMGLHSQLQYGIFFDNCYKTYFNFGASNDRFSSFAAEDGEMNYYFIYHSNVSQIISSYTHLTGRMELPPLWSLGLQQCRYSYYPDTEVLNIAHTFRQKSIPADVIYLDIHYMDAYKIFTWNKDRFPQPKKMLDELKSIGFHTVVIVDPGIKVEKGYPSYEQGVKDSLFLTYPDKTYYTGQVWPGWCHFPDFTNSKVRKWWGGSFKGYVEDGIEGFWNDMNEPASWGQKFPDLVEFNFEGQKATSRRGHNVYGLNMARSTAEGTKELLKGKRPFILTRAGYSGVQRYSAVWTGDNVSSDDHMMAGVRLLSSMGLTGVSFTGMDIGGFTGGASKELFARWVSIGAFSPMFRIHSAIDTKEAEPWSFGERSEEIAKNYISFRYRLMPYIYSTFYESVQTGIPVNRSLAINFPHDEKIYDGRYQNQYFFGPGILVAPSESSKEFSRVYLPGNDWYDFYNDKYFAGNEELVVESPVSRLPVFIPGSSIIPMQSQLQNLSEKPTDTLQVHVYYGKKNNAFTYFEDDGSTYEYKNGNFHSRKISFEPSKKAISFDTPQGKSKSKFSYIKIVFHGFNELKTEVTLAGKKQKVVSEKINFIKPLSHFDPIGQGAQPELVNVKSVTVSNVSEGMNLSW